MTGENSVCLMCLASVSMSGHIKISEVLDSLGAKIRVRNRESNYMCQGIIRNRYSIAESRERTLTRVM